MLRPKYNYSMPTLIDVGDDSERDTQLTRTPGVFDKDDDNRYPTEYSSRGYLLHTHHGLERARATPPAGRTHLGLLPGQDTPAAGRARQRVPAARIHFVAYSRGRT